MNAPIDLENPIGLGCALEAFTEVDEVNKLIDTLAKGETNATILENAAQRFVTIADYYQEQPHLLDRIIPVFFKSLLDIGVDEKFPLVCRHHAFRFMYYLTKTRGYKNVLKLLPHEVSDLPLALKTLQDQDVTDISNWETRYMLFIWLSVIVLIPFEMSRFDGTGVSVSKQLLEIGHKYLAVADATRDAAAFFLSKFLTRPDTVKKHLGEFLNHSIMSLRTECEKEFAANTFLIMSILRSFSLIFKHGKRSELESYASQLYQNIKMLNLHSDQRSLYRKGCCKLFHRLGLVHLKTKVASWRYKKGARSLNVNSLSNGGKEVITNGIVNGAGGDGGRAALPNNEESTGDVEMEFECEDEIHEDVESILNDLLGLFVRDPDTIVRWSAAKSVGRITARLPLELANDIIDTIMGNFNVLENEHTWSGSCLALAELARRGLILPERLPELIPVLGQSLQFEQQRGFTSVGAGVRDAACFVAWALPRTFSKSVMLPFVEKIASDLILVVLFDREVNCRRAASAAFQENVGRHGKLPNGIEILTLADYNAVGVRSDCYVKMSVEIARFHNYEKSIIDHIAEKRVNHWDESIRILAAEALAGLCSVNSMYILNQILPTLVKNMSRNELNVRYGSIKSTASVLLSLHNLGNSAKEIVDEDMGKNINELVNNLENNNFLKGLGGETIKPVICEFISKVCETDFYDVANQHLESNLLSFLISCVKHKKEAIQTAGALSTRQFINRFTSCHAEVSKILLEGLECNDGSERAGFALLCGQLPTSIFTSDYLDKIVTNFLNLLEKTIENAVYAPARVNALNSISAIFSLKCEAKEANIEKFLENIFDAINFGLQDYSVNERGNIGAKTREAAMQVFASCLSEVAANDLQSLLPDDKMNRCLCLIMTQISSRIDSVRRECLSCLTILYNHKLIRHFKEGAKLEQLVGEFASINEEDRENYCSIKMLRFVYPMLHLDTYTYYILIGLTSCIGGMSESFCRETLAAFHSYVQMIAHDSEKCSYFLNAYLQVFEENRGNDRIIIPFLEGTALLLQAGIFDALHAEETDFGERLVGYLSEEARTFSYAKLALLVNLFSALLLSSNSKIHAPCLKKMLIFLGHQFPKLRKHAAGQLFENILICPEITMELPEEDQEKVQNLLSDFDWNKADTKSARETRNVISELLGLPPPKPIDKSTTANKNN